MKKYFIVCLYLSLILFISLTDGAPASAGEKKSNGSQQVIPNLKNSADWIQYSWGLYYKNVALKDRSSSGKDSYLKKAIHCFREATASGAALDKIYFQMAECYFHLNDYNTTIDYARKSIAINNADMRPYNRIYNTYLKMKNYPAAAQILEDYLAIKPESVQVQFILAEHYNKNMHDLDKTVAAYRKVITLSDRLPIEDYYKEQSYFNLAGIMYQKGEVDDSVLLYMEVLNINKDNYDAIYYLALTSMELYDLQNAEKYSQQFLLKRPSDKIINSVLGRIYYLRDDVRALSFLSKAKNTGSMSGILAWGLYCELLRNDEMAEKLLATVMKFAPKTTSLHLAMARINFRKGDTTAAFNEYVTTGILMYNSKLLEEAKRNFNEALHLNNTVAGVYYYLGKVHEDLQSHSLALYYYIKANTLQPDVDLTVHIGYLYGVKKDYDNAMRNFNKAMERDPNNSRPYFFKGLISIWQEDYSAAEKNIEHAINLDDKSETYYFYHAIVMERTAHLDRAIDSLEKAIKHNPNSGRAYNYLGYLYADNNMKIDESLNLIQKALELEPGNGAYTDSLGWVYFRKGDFKHALEKLLHAEQILRKENNSDPVVYDHIGDTYLKLGHIDNALKYWSKSNDIKKSNAIQDKIKKYQNK